MQLEKINNLLIVRLSSLGDILLTTPLIRTIKENYPHIKIDFLLRERYYDLLRYNPNVDKNITINNDKDKLRSLKNQICINNYDLVIDLQNNLRSLRLLKCYGSSVVSFKKRNLEKFLLVNFKVNKLKERLPIPVMYAQSIEGVRLDGEGIDLYTDKKPNRLLEMRENFIGFCPGSRHYTKMWPTDYYIELGRLLEKNNYKVVLFGGENDKQICLKIASELKFAINLCNDDDILQTASDMKMCRLIFCNDSGLMHTATAMHVPVIAFFGSTVQEFGFAPYKAEYLIMENEFLTCRPCSHIGRSRCPKKHFKCMKDILPEQAFQKMNVLINNE